MRETSIMDDLNQVDVRVWEENIEMSDTYWNNLVVNDESLKDHIGKVGVCIKMIFSRMIHHRMKMLVVYKINY